MITTINKAVLHIMDFNSGMTVLAEEELDANNNSVLTFLTKHIEKLNNDPNSKAGTFYPESEFHNCLVSYVNGTLDFLDFSAYIAKVMYSSIAQTDKASPADLIVCDVNADDNRLFAILKCNNQVGFTHQVTNSDGKVKNEIINHYAILPNISQKLDEYAIIEMNSLKIKFNDKKRVIDGKETFVIPERILECSASISSKGAIDLVSDITRKVSENHGESTVAAVSKAKNYIVENAVESDYLDPIELGKKVFSSSPMLQEEYIKEIKTAGMPETVQVDQDFAIKKNKSHRIKTDTGIEIEFPVDYFKNNDYIEFINNPNGTISIELKNIGKIINK